MWASWTPSPRPKPFSVRCKPALNTVLRRIVVKTGTLPALNTVLHRIVVKTGTLPALNTVLRRIVAKIWLEFCYSLAKNFQWNRIK